jgi:hypothetical protein
MPSILLPLNAVGPTLDIGVSTPASLVSPGATPAAPPQITWFRAIADTGCSHTSIHSSIAARCGLKTISKSIAFTPAGNVAVNMYHGDLFLRSLVSWSTPFDWPFRDRAFLEMVQQNPNFDALLGMDILSMGVFTTNGGLRQASFSW